MVAVWYDMKRNPIKVRLINNCPLSVGKRPVYERGGGRGKEEGRALAVVRGLSTLMGSHDTMLVRPDRR